MPLFWGICVDMIKMPSCLQTNVRLPKGSVNSPGFQLGFNPGKHSIKRFALKGHKICLDQSHTYRSSKRIPCLFS